VRYLRSHRHVDGNALAVQHCRSQPHRAAGTTADRSLTGKEAAPMHGDPLPLLGQDEAEVLRLVEPKHRAVHGFAGVSEKGRLGIRSHARFRHIGQGGSAPVMLIPYPHALHAELRGTSLALRTDAPPPSPNG